MPVSIYTTDHKAETIERVVDAVKEFNAANRNERIAFRLASGNVGVMAATNEEVEASQFPILAYVYGAVIVLCLLSFRSISATVCIIVPLAVVSLLAYALMALLQIGLKVSTLPVVALGGRDRGGLRDLHLRAAAHPSGAGGSTSPPPTSGRWLPPERGWYSPA